MRHGFPRRVWGWKSGFLVLEAGKPEAAGSRLRSPEGKCPADKCLASRGVAGPAGAPGSAPHTPHPEPEAASQQLNSQPAGGALGAGPEGSCLERAASIPAFNFQATETSCCCPRRPHLPCVHTGALPRPKRETPALRGAPTGADTPGYSVTRS